ncbi:MAG: hypothetical protein ABIN45_03930, partial [Gammaproteobacteria bacterium]
MRAILCTFIQMSIQILSVNFMAVNFRARWPGCDQCGYYPKSGAKSILDPFQAGAVQCVEQHRVEAA